VIRQRFGVEPGVDRAKRSEQACVTGMAPAACIWSDSPAAMTVRQASSRACDPALTTSDLRPPGQAMVPLASSSASKDAARPPREETAMLR
jgi:hypothetical protein